jgi:hypothetical protein
VSASPLPPLAEWETFYVIIGSSAAALAGLVFVVIALGAEARTVGSPTGLRAFASPTVVHFCAVLLLATLISTPRQTTASLRACLLASGAAGLSYVGWVAVQVRWQRSYVPVLSDWLWHTWLPVVAYVGLVVAGALLPRSPDAALHLVGGTGLLLLYVGIHNAWDSAVWITTKGQELPK